MLIKYITGYKLYKNDNILTRMLCSKKKTTRYRYEITIKNTDRTCA